MNNTGEFIKILLELKNELCLNLIQLHFIPFFRRSCSGVAIGRICNKLR